MFGRSGTEASLVVEFGNPSIGEGEELGLDHFDK